MRSRSTYAREGDDLSRGRSLVKSGVAHGGTSWFGWGGEGRRGSLLFRRGERGESLSFVGWRGGGRRCGSGKGSVGGRERRRSEHRRPLRFGVEREAGKNDVGSSRGAASRGKVSLPSIRWRRQQGSANGSGPRPCPRFESSRRNNLVAPMLSSKLLQPRYHGWIIARERDKEDAMLVWEVV